MKAEFKVKAIIGNNEYFLSQVFYNNTNSHRIEIIKNNEGTIFIEKFHALEAINIHKRSRLDQKVEEYIIIELTN